MKALFIYLMQVIAASGILYAYYHFVLRNKKFHQYNRYYILAAIVISLVLPLFNIPVYFSPEQTSASPVLRSLTGPAEIPVGSGQLAVGSGQLAKDSTWFSLTNITWLFYGLLAGLVLARLLFSLLRIRRMMRSNPVEKLDNIRFVNTNDPATPFSFFRWLFWNRRIDLNSTEGGQVFRHEYFHIRERHSLDILLLEILHVFFWFNPFFWLFKKEIKAIHEFLADQFAMKEVSEINAEQAKWKYAELLLKQALRTNHRLVNPFFHTQIKRRIMMITTSSKPGYQYLRKVMVLPITAIVIAICTLSFKIKNEYGSIIIEGNVKGLKDGKIYLSEAHQWQKQLYSTEVKDGRFQFKINTSPDFKPYLASINFPDDNSNSGIGQLMFNTGNSRHIQSGFYLNKGNISLINDPDKPEYEAPNGASFITVLLNADYDLNKPAQLPFPSDTAIGVNFTGDIVVKKEGDKKVFLANVNIVGKIEPGDTTEPIENTVIFVDGKERKDFTSLNDLNKRMDPSTIQSITIYKQPHVQQKFGISGKKSVIDIVTKKITDLKNSMDAIIKNEMEKTDTVKPNHDNKIFEKVEIEPAFPGGAEKWKQYLNSTIDPTIPVLKGARKGKYTVIVQFIVHRDGTISDVRTLTKHGYDMEEEAMRVIKKGPRWIPAVQNGYQVNAYRKQPITFEISDDPKPVKNKKVAVTITGENSADLTNLSIGKDNYVNIITSNYSLTDLDLHSTHGKIYGGSGRYLLSELKEKGEATLWVTDKKGNELGRWVIPIDGLPDPFAGTVVNPKVTVSQLKKMDAFNLLQVNNSVEIVGFTFTIDQDNGDIEESKNGGKELTERTKALIAAASPGKVITIDNIKVKYDGRLARIPARVYYVVADEPVVKKKKGGK